MHFDDVCWHFAMQPSALPGCSRPWAGSRLLLSLQVSPFSKSPPDSVDGKFALGGRVNAYVSSFYTYAPNLDVELYHWPWCKSLFMYLNLVPRRSLVCTAASVRIAASHTAYQCCISAQ
jgi:hypothetical protein